MSKIAACLIVKNSEAMLDRCLESIRPFVDGVFVYDTGSTDETLELLAEEGRFAHASLHKQTGEILGKMGEGYSRDPVENETTIIVPLAPITVEQGEWRNDFAWAREQSFAMPDESYDWLLWLDDDDVIEGAPNLRAYVHNAPADCHGYVFFYDYARDEHGNNVCQLWRERLIRRSAGYRWANPVHEVLIPPEGVTPALAKVPAEQCRWVHHRPTGERYSPDRNLEILLGEVTRLEEEGKPVEPRTLAYLGTEYMAKGAFAEAAAYLQAYREHPEAGWSDERSQVDHKLGLCLRMLGNPLAAIGVENEAIGRRRDWAENHVGIACARAAVGQWRAAELDAQEALRLGLPDSPLILNPIELQLLPLFVLADAYLNMQKLDEARAAIHEAARLAPEMAAEKLAQVDAAANEAEIVGALMLLREVLVRHDENLKAHHLMQCVPYIVADNPHVIHARAAQREMVKHALEPAEYKRWYRDEPKESTVPDEYVETIDEHIERAAFLLQNLQLQEAELGRKPRVLDLGCNDAWMAGFLWKRGGYTVDGIELNKASVEKAEGRRQRFGFPGAVIHGDIFDAAELTGRKYDAVSMFEVLEHLPDIPAALTMLEGLVRKGGRIYLTTPNGAFERGNIAGWARVERKGHLHAIPAHLLAEHVVARGEVSDFRIHNGNALSFIGYTPGRRRASITFYAGGQWEPWSPAQIKDGGIGGSETALAQVATRLARAGHYVRVYSGAQHDGQSSFLTEGGVLWRPFTAWDPTEEVDLLVVSRRPDVFNNPVGAKQSVLWCHDHSYPGMMTEQRATRMDRVAVLTDWMVDRFTRLYPYLDGKLTILRNGVTLTEADGTARYKRANRGFRKRKPRLIYSSSADRGLDVMLELWPAIKARVPDAELHIFYGWDTFDRVAITDPTMLAYKAELLRLAAEAGGEDGGIFMRGRVGQVRLAKEMMWARALAYPTAFLETFCITALEAQAAGLPIVTSDLGALHETVGEHGIRLPWAEIEDTPHNRTPGYQQAFIEAAVLLLTDEEYWAGWHEKALMGAAGQDWQDRLDDWEALLKPQPRRKRAA